MNCQVPLQQAKETPEENKLNITTGSNGGASTELECSPRSNDDESSWPEALYELEGHLAREKSDCKKGHFKKILLPENLFGVKTQIEDYAKTIDLKTQFSSVDLRSVTFSGKGDSLEEIENYIEGLSSDFQENSQLKDDMVGKYVQELVKKPKFDLHCDSTLLEMKVKLELEIDTHYENAKSYIIIGGFKKKVEEFIKLLKQAEDDFTWDMEMNKKKILISSLEKKGLKIEFDHDEMSYEELLELLKEEFSELGLE